MAGMTLEEMNRKAAEKPVETPAGGWDVEDGEVISEEQQMHLDIRAAMLLLSQASTLMEYVGTPEICKTVSKKERTALRAMKRKVREFLDENREFYFEKEEDI